MSYSWIKLYHEILHNPKMGMLPDRLWNLSVKCFLLAGEYGQRGLLPSLSQMAWTLRVDPEALEAELHELEEVKIVQLTPDGWKVVNFDKRQASMDDAERKRLSRSSHKSVTLTSQPVTKNVQEEEEEEDSEEESEGEVDSEETPSRARRASSPKPETSGKTSTAKPACPPVKNTLSADFPAAVKVFLERGGRLPAGKLANGTRKADKAVELIAGQVGAAPENLDFWGQVVEGYVQVWSPKSYTIMLNDYYLRRRIPGQNGSGRPANDGPSVMARELQRVMAEAEHGN